MSARRGAKDLRTMAGVIDARRSRSAHGALLEMSMLEMERQRLAGEARRLQHRCADIAVRIGQIERRQHYLQSWADRRADGEAGQATPVATSSPPVRSKRLAY